MGFKVFATDSEQAPMVSCGQRPVSTAIEADQLSLSLGWRARRDVRCEHRRRCFGFLDSALTLAVPQ